MPMSLDLTSKAELPDPAPMVGISEWACYYANHPHGPAPDPERVIEDTIDAQLAVGIDWMVWDAGRSQVNYWSDLPHTTPMLRGQTKVQDTDWSVHLAVFKRFCPLRRAHEHCAREAMPFLVRLAMNRHYGGDVYAAHTSQFVCDHPEYREIGKRGGLITHRLCYAIPEVRAERIDILLEVQRIGAQALVLDYCRQMPVLGYHPALLEPYLAKTGRDPRSIVGTDPAPYMDWFQFRTDVLTGFMRELRDAVRKQEHELGRPCPVIARVPDYREWLMIACGLDIERWAADDLIDAVMLSPFPRIKDDLGRHPEHAVAAMHRHGKACIGGVGSKCLIEVGKNENTGFYDPQPVYAMADLGYAAGVDAMSLYQSESLARMAYLASMLPELARPSLCARHAAELPRPDFPPDYPIACDWHSLPEGQEALDVEIAGNQAL